MRLSHRRAYAALEALEGGPRPKKTTLEALDNHLILYHNVHPNGIPAAVKRMIAKAVEQAVKNGGW